MYTDMAVSNIKILKILIFLMLIPFFIWYSYWLVVPTVYGDAESYQELYDALSNASFDDIRRLGRFYVSSNELTPYVIWIGAKLNIEKDTYITFFNVILLCGIFLFSISRRINFCTIFLAFLLVTNFYVVVLLTSAERLKFAYVMLILASLLSNKKKVFFFLSSITMHFQSIIFVAAQIVYVYAGRFKDSLLNKRSNEKGGSKFKLFILIFFIFACFVFFKDGITSKMYAALNSSRGGFGELVQLVLLFIAVFPLVKKKFETVAMFLLYGIAIFLIGGSRVNMLAYSSVVFIILSEGSLDRFNIKSIPFYLISIYLSFKSIGYIERTFIQGHGWLL